MDRYHLLPKREAVNYARRRCGPPGASRPGDRSAVDAPGDLKGSHPRAWSESDLALWIGPWMSEFTTPGLIETPLAARRRRAGWTL